MYYYIFDPPQGTKEYELTAQIKEYLSALGIAGEMTSPSAGKEVEQLVELAISKRYSTIVAVGGTQAINRIARAVEPHDVVLGIVPIAEHPDILRLTGLSDWKSAAEALKRRRWQPVRLGVINNQIGFLTPAHLSVASDNQYQLETPNFSLTGTESEITIQPQNAEDGSGDQLVIEIVPPEKPKGFLHSLLGGRKSKSPESSRFTVARLKLNTTKPVSVEVAGTTLANTPIACTVQQKSLKLIVAKGLKQPHAHQD